MLALEKWKMAEWWTESLGGQFSPVGFDQVLRISLSEFKGALNPLKYQVIFVNANKKVFVSHLSYVACKSVRKGRMTASNLDTDIYQWIISDLDR